jgi:plastocyanin domain-containing protein
MLGRAVLFLGIAALIAGCSGSSQDASSGHRIAITVTDNGFEPASVEVPAGKAITLVVTRKTDATCAKQIVFEHEGIRKELPLDQAVEVTVPPSPKGEITYSCDMGMISGKLVVQ